MADWISSAVGGLVGAAAGGSFSVWVARGRLRFDRQQADADRTTERRAVARPAVVSLADLFTEVEGKVTPSWETEYVNEPEPDFGEWWNTESERTAPRLRRLVLEVPGAEDRERFEVVVHGMEWSWPIHQRMNLGDQEEYLRRVSRLGAELAGAWLRDEPTPDPVAALLLDLRRATEKTHREMDHR